jgi:hypothetical protein
MRILRGLSSRVLPCGCLSGVYETYDGAVVGILDAQGAACPDTSHQPGQTIALDATDHLACAASLPLDRHPTAR